MPTGYTSPIYEGKDIALRDFLLLVSRGLGLAVHQRDEDLSEPLRRREPSTAHHDKRLKEARERWEEATRWTEFTAQFKANAAYEEALSRHDERARKNDAMRRRYRAMIDQVRRWAPATDAGKRVREFALEQLKGSLDFDTHDDTESKRFWPLPERESGEEYRERIRAEALRDIEYATRYRDEEIERCREFNEAIDDFYADLPE